MRLFRNRIHAYVLLGVVGATQARRRPALAALLLAPYLRERVAANLTPGRRDPRSLARLALHLPARAVIDVVEVAATATSGVQHRAVVI